MIIHLVNFQLSQLLNYCSKPTTIVLPMFYIKFSEIPNLDIDRYLIDFTTTYMCELV